MVKAAESNVVHLLPTPKPLLPGPDRAMLLREIAELADEVVTTASDLAKTYTKRRKDEDGER